MLARMMSDLSPISELHEEMNRWMESFFEDLPSARRFAATYPALNIWEDADAGYVEAELPGMSMNDLEVLVQGNQLTINGQRKIQDAANARCYRSERGSGQFSRTLTLPWDIDADHVQAKLQDGVLSLKLAKPEAHKPKKIQVQSA